MKINLRQLRSKISRRRPLGQAGAAGQARPATRAARGQALIIIAMAMVGLLAFVGLTVDSGILFIGEGHLRRAVDAAALAAATQFRVGSDSNRLQVTAAEVVHMNGVDPTTLVLTICSPGDPSATPPIAADSHNDSALCPANGAPHKKLVKVKATTKVTFAFLAIIGIPSTQITADATSETASVDVVLVIDTSNSMTFDVSKSNPSGYWYPNGKLDGATNAYDFNNGCNEDPLLQNPDPTYTGYCLPFDQVKKAAVEFVHHLYWPYDRLAIVTFDQSPTLIQPLNNSLTEAQWESAIKALKVSDPRDPPAAGCNWTHYAADATGSDLSADPSGCTNTSTGGGLQFAGNEFGKAPIRQESVWVVILLTDGGANASVAGGGKANSACPPATWRDLTNDPAHFDPFCRDWDKTTRHTELNPQVYVTSGIDTSHTVPYNPQSTFNIANYDADDYARDQADFVACPAKLAQAAKYCRDSLDYSSNKGGQGALIYSIGLGQLVVNNSSGGGVCTDGTNVPCNQSTNPEIRVNPTDTRAGYDAGDYLLRYISNVGADGNPDPTAGPDGCQGVAPPKLIFDAANPANAPTLTAGNLSYNCGNYFFSQTGTGLSAVFQSIASRIFTRITQ